VPGRTASELDASSHNTPASASEATPFPSDLPMAAQPVDSDAFDDDHFDDDFFAFLRDLDRDK
jgi:hypothetical protein